MSMPPVCAEQLKLIDIHLSLGSFELARSLAEATVAETCVFDECPHRRTCLVKCLAAADGLKAAASKN